MAEQIINANKLHIDVQLVFAAQAIMKLTRGNGRWKRKTALLIKIHVIPIANECP
ncbi:hypothetical protein [Rossellomorea aquimaris]|uniref:hypothetical protein n=1 Tax=Rossellomorea TaxID=2837508 RepID=UPI0016539A28|nr:hypothetical protein [Rossellomorea aquimaris]